MERQIEHVPVHVKKKKIRKLNRYQNPRQMGGTGRGGRDKRQDGQVKMSPVGKRDRVWIALLWLASANFTLHPFRKRFHVFFLF